MATMDRHVKQFVRSGAYQTTKALGAFVLDPPSDDDEFPRKPASKPTVPSAKIAGFEARVVLMGGDPRRPFKGIPALQKSLASVDTESKLISEINADQEVAPWLRNYGLRLPEDHLEAFLTYTNIIGVRLTIRLDDYNVDVGISPNTGVEVHEVLKLDKLMGQLSDYMFVDEYNKNIILGLEENIRKKDAELAAKEADIAENASLRAMIANLQSEVAALQLINDDLEEDNKNRTRVTRSQAQPQGQGQGRGKGKGKRKRDGK